jgi:hypothetical protein
VLREVEVEEREKLPRSGSDLFSAADPRVPEKRSLEIYFSNTSHTLPTQPHLSFHSLLSESTMAATAPPTTTGSTKLDAFVQTATSKEPQKLSGVGLYSRFVRLTSGAC